MFRLAFIDHGFKEQTGSSDFLINLLKKSFRVDIFWDHSYNGGKPYDFKGVSGGKYDVIIFFQILDVTEYDLFRLNCKTIVIIPMFDHARNISGKQWKWYKDCKVVNFSRYMHNRLVSLGLDSFYIQYYPPPDKITRDDYVKELKGFFWQRSLKVTWPLIKKLVSDTRFVGFHLHLLPKFRANKEILPTLQDEEGFGISYSEWFSDKMEYLDLVKESSVFFVPRKYEGIGMAFLEAMAMGKCVVAPDYPTMNEYIENGRNGVLYNYNDPKQVDLTDFMGISWNAQKSIVEGYRKWNSEKEEILEFITRDIEKTQEENRFSKPPLSVVIRSRIFHLKKYFERKFPVNSKRVTGWFKKLES